MESRLKSENRIEIFFNLEIILLAEKKMYKFNFPEAGINFTGRKIV